MSGIFQAYLAHRDTSFRCVLAFSNSHVADEWWRHVSTHADFVQFDLKRASPQYYTFTTRARHRNSSRLLVNWPVIPTPQEFSERMSIATTYQGSPATHTPVISAIAPQNIPNRISGAWFYIRSRSPSAFYWDIRSVVDKQGRIIDAYNIISTTGANTLFRVVARDLPVGTVLVGTDIVTLQIENPNTKRRELLNVVRSFTLDRLTSEPEADDDNWTSNGSLGFLTTSDETISHHPANEFKFSDIEAGIFIVDRSTSKPWPIIHVANNADVTRGFAHHGWELVGL